MVSRTGRRLAGLALAVAVGLSAAGADAGGITESRQAELTRLVRQDCGSCHGMTLKGGLGRPLLPDDLAGRSAEALATVVLDGIPGTPMPPWRGLLSDDEALWIATRLTQGLTQGPDR